MEQIILENIPAHLKVKKVAGISQFAFMKKKLCLKTFCHQMTGLVGERRAMEENSRRYFTWHQYGLHAGDLSNVFKYLMRWCTQDRDRLLSVVQRERTRGDRHKMRYKEFHLNIRKVSYRKGDSALG